MKIKKILLHGATNCNSSNYGDFIYGEIVYDFLRKKNYECQFYQPSQFFKKYLREYKHLSDFKYDMLIYIPGGYFGEGHNARFRDNIVQFLRFMPIGIKCIIARKPILVLAIGAGPTNNFFMKKSVQLISKNAKFITTRDEYSYDFIKSVSPDSNVSMNGDLILTHNFNNDCKSEQINKIIEMASERKIILVHYNHSEKAKNLFVDALNQFVDNNKFFIVVSSDSIIENDLKYFNDFKDKYKYDCAHFNYIDPYEMTQLIKHVDVVLTCKLHVGVVSAMFHKSVISVACHPEKTKRFYEQIGEDGRCISIDECDTNKLLVILKKYINRYIYIDNGLIEKSKQTWFSLERYLENRNEE